MFGTSFRIKAAAFAMAFAIPLVAHAAFTITPVSGFGFVKSIVDCDPPNVMKRNISFKAVFDISAVAECRGAGQVSGKGNHRAIASGTINAAGDTANFLDSDSARAVAFGTIAWANWKDQGENESEWTVTVPNTGNSVWLVGKYRAISRTPKPTGGGTISANSDMGFYTPAGVLGLFLSSNGTPIQTGKVFICVPSGASFSLVLMSNAVAQAWSVLPKGATTDATASVSLELTDTIRVLEGGCNALEFYDKPNKEPSE